ncbi:hypothetical protein [Streptomyces sp. NRRL F-525]|uniref:hypothetical protein n=1 Tax=Streptomyces sp. NRRL F-525 TaxID=1463861 RepID=UPI00131C0850|nr:hypothetical protein [Streptomyces sp. NRRL F-525]
MLPILKGRQNPLPFDQENQGNVMRKFRTALVVAGLLLTTAAVQTGTANASTKAPASFVEMTEKWSGTAVVRLWWNTSNGGIHAEYYDPGNTTQAVWVGIYDATTRQILTQSETYGPGPINTGEVFTARSIFACGAGGRVAQFCTGNT